MAHPIFFPASRIALWNRMASGTSTALGNQWGRYIKSCADGAAPGGEQNVGQWAAWWYAATQDAAYAATGASLLSAFVLPGPQGSRQDQITDNIVRVLLVYDLLYPYLAQTGQEAAIRNALNTLWVGTLRSAQHGNLIDIRTHDADACDADYWMLALCDLAFSPSPGYTQGQYWDSTQGKAQPVGGFDFNPALGPYGSLRNILHTFAGYAAGGRWFYSSGYNLNIERYDFLAVDAVRQATGADHFPEFTALIPLMFVGHVLAFTGDVFTGAGDSDKWGDEADPYRHIGQVNGQRYADLMGLYQGLLSGNGTTPANATYGPISTAWWEAFTGLSFGRASSSPSQPTSYFLFQLNPEASASANWRADLAAAWGSTLHAGIFNTGRGIYQPGLKGGGLGPNSPMYVVGATFGKDVLQSDHEQFYKWVGTCQLYHKGAWALRNNVADALATDQCDMVTGVLHAGLSAMYRQGPQAIEADLAGTEAYLYYRAGTEGPYYGPAQPVNNPPAAFVSEHTRTIYGLPSQDGTQDTLVVFDRINSTPPTEVDQYASVATELDQQKINSPMTRALKMLCWHPRSLPTENPGPILTWPVTDGPAPYAVDLAPLLPTNNIAVWSFDETDSTQVAWFNGLPCAVPDCTDVGFQTRLYPQTDEPFLFFLTVVNAYDAGQKPVYTAVQDQQGLAAGVLLSRGANVPTLVMEGCAEAGRVISAPFSFTLPGKGEKLVVFFGSLDTTKASWSAEIGTRVTKLKVTPAGIGAATLWCGGGKTVTVFPG